MSHAETFMLEMLYNARLMSCPRVLGLIIRGDPAVINRAWSIARTHAEKVMVV